MSNLYSKNFDDADEVKTPPKAKVDIVKLGNINASKLVVISGRLGCSHDDGSKIEVGPGDAYYFAPGHDGWVVGDEPCVMYEIVEAGKDFGPWTKAN